jgi:hypothetical protein
MNGKEKKSSEQEEPADVTFIYFYRKWNVKASQSDDNFG